MKILIVDDLNSAIQALERDIIATLAKLDISNTEFELIHCYCSSVAKAKEEIKKSEPNILFLDYSLGSDGTGADIARWIDHDKRPVKVASQSLQHTDRAIELFRGTKCVTVFLGFHRAEREENLEAFLKECFRR